MLAEARHLQTTDSRLFAEPMTPERAASLSLDIDLAERTDAFVARFGRLQDTLADKLLPALLDWLAEPVAPAIDNLNRAERLGWVQSVDLWIEARRLCSRMVHQYVRDPTELALALMAHGAVGCCLLPLIPWRHGSWRVSRTEVPICQAERGVVIKSHRQSAVPIAMGVGKLMGLVNCAGITPAVKTVGKDGAHPLTVFTKTVMVNLVGSFNMIRLAADAMCKNEPEATGERGVMISTASVAAYDGQIGQAAYSAHPRAASSA